jgi:outer membrane protein assembly factor BamA
MPRVSPALPLLRLVLAGLCTLASGVLAEEIPVAEEAELEKERGNTLIPFPFVYYTPETETAFGATVSYYFRTSQDSTRNWPSSIAAVIIYTQKKQFITALGGDIYLSEGEYHLVTGISYLRFPNTFWGVGNDAPDSAEEDYTSRSFSVGAVLQKRVAPDWYAGLALDIAHRELTEVEEGGLLATHAVPGTADGWVIGTGVQVDRDTRDSNVYPTRGSFLKLVTSLNDGRLGSDYDFSAFALDVRRYVPLGPWQVLALRAVGLGTTATPPFDLLPALGGDTLLRGYYAGRYRDRNLVAFQAEARTPFWRRLGAVAFLALGQVAHDPGDLSTGAFHPAGGLGLRFLLSREEHLNLRADWGVGQGDSGFYLGIGEVF